MSTALIVTKGMGGNVPPMLGVGRELARRGWRVVVHADEPVRDRIEREGFDFVPATGFPYDPVAPHTDLQDLRDIPRLWADRVRGRDAVAAARAAGADIAVVDVLFVGATAELAAVGVPVVVVAHSTWEGVRIFMGPPLGLLMRLHGTAPMRALARADRVLVASDERLGRALPLPANTVHVGPVLEDPPAPAAPRERPLVLLSLSSVAFPGQRETFQRLLDAVAPLPVDVAAGTGSAVAAEGLRPGANTALVRVVDHRALMPEAAAVITHGGHATTVRALAHGLPMLLVPMHPMMDQPRIAKAVEAAGAGIAVPRTAPAQRYREALQRLLDEPSFAEHARGLGADLVAADGARRAADEIEAVAASRVASA